MLTNGLKIALLTALALPALVPACASSQESNLTLKERYPDLIQLTPPEKENVPTSKLYVDSVRVESLGEELVLLIRGDLPDGCTHIGSARHAVNETEISLTLDAWSDPELLCTQALVPFTFVYRSIPENELTGRTAITVNETSYTLSDKRN